MNKYMMNLPAGSNPSLSAPKNVLLLAVPEFLFQNWILTSVKITVSSSYSLSGYLHAAICCREKIIFSISSEKNSNHPSSLDHFIFPFPSFSWIGEPGWDQTSDQTITIKKSVIHFPMVIRTQLH